MLAKGRKVQTRHTRRCLRTSRYNSHNQQVCGRQCTLARLTWDSTETLTPASEITTSASIRPTRYWQDVDYPCFSTKDIRHEEHEADGAGAQCVRRQRYRCGERTDQDILQHKANLLGLWSRIERRERQYGWCSSTVHRLQAHHTRRGGCNDFNGANGFATNHGEVHGQHQILHHRKLHT